MKGVIAAGDPQTAAAGKEILELGGNAVDAAVAAVFASFVAESVMTNIGGGGLALVVDRDSPNGVVYDFFVDMPSGQITSDINFHKIISDYGPEQVPLHIGRGSAAVPGIVSGLCTLLEERGTFSLKDVLAPAIRMARRGVILSPSQEYVLDFLTPIYADTPEVTRMYSPNGKPWKAGQRNTFPKFANTLEQLTQEGPESFVTGEFARAIVADQKKNGGLIKAEDLRTYQVHRLEPIRIRYRDFELLLPPVPSSGGALIAFALKLLEAMQVDRFEHNSVEHARVLAEVMRLSSVARPAWDAPALSTEKRIARFLNEAHIAKYQEKLQAILEGEPSPNEPNPPREPDHTTHISVIDAQGNMIGVTTTAGESAGFVVPGTGICMNNMLGEADLHPNGFHRLPPGERVTTMMSPTLVLEDGEPVLALGSGGSSRLRSAIFQVLSNVLDFKMTLPKAVDAPRVHFEEGVLQLEGGILDKVADGLVEEHGYTVNRWPGRNMFFGGVHATAKVSGKWVAAGDDRRGGVGLIV
jgi:gamma-glutamyltranspeptidase/glutathione hydrolase